MAVKELDEYIANGFKVPDAMPPPPAEETPMIHAIDAETLSGKVFEPLVEPVQGLIVEGLTLLCGASKAGKSWLMIQLCAAVATGTPFLGRKTTQGQVLYCAFEDSERRLKSRIVNQGTAVNEALQFCTKTMSLDAGLLDALDGWIINNPQANLIVIDTLQKVRGQIPGRANAYAEDYKVVGQLKAFADRHHIALVCVHHLNKLRDVSDPYDKISGSTGLMGAADTIILIDRPRGKDDATVTYTGRDVFGDDFQMRFENCRWNVCDPAMLERERYESDPVVVAIKLLLSQPSFDGTRKISYQGFSDWAAQHSLFVGTSQADTHRKLDAVTEKLYLYDHISITHDRRVNGARGFILTKRGGLSNG